MTRPLVLFDIDGTLLRGRGDGVGAMLDAFKDLYPNHDVTLDGIPVAGRLDTLIWADAVRRVGLDDSPPAEARFRAAYGPCLARRIASGAHFRQMPGALGLVQRLNARDDLTIGLLTGNYVETARMKVTAAGYDADHFRLGAFAGDGPDRRSLPPVAMRRVAALHGQPAHPTRVVIIGDTPHDIDCAHFNGCRALGVATGDFTVDDLVASRADWVLPTLEDHDAVERWLFARSTD